MGEFEKILANCKKRGVIIYPPKPKKFSEIKTLFFAWDFAVKQENLNFIETLVKSTFPKGYKIEYSYIWQDGGKKGRKLQVQHVKFTNR